MKNLVIILTLLLISACSGKQVLLQKKDKNAHHEIHETPIIVEKDTFLISELRFYKILSAKDSMKMMYEHHGEWNKRLEGKYQSNIDQLVWENIDLLGNEERFTVIADGTETESNYFASIMIFDANNTDCLNNSYPQRSELLNAILEKMRQLSSDTSTYKLF